MRRLLHSNKRIAALGLIAISAAAVLAIEAVTASGHPSAGPGGMSNPGTLVASLPITQVADLARSGVDPNVRELGSRAGISFYTGTSRGGRCFLTSNAEAPTPEFSVVACQTPGATAVPSDTTPLVDFSALVKHPGDSAPHLNWLAGFAADNVNAVGVLSTNGDLLAQTPVVGNIFAARQVTSSEISAIVALDKNGQTIYTEPVP